MSLNSVCREVKIHEQATKAITQAAMRARGGHARQVAQERRQQHLQDILGLWVAATRAFRTAAERIETKHRGTCEYEIQAGLALMLRLEYRRLFDPLVSACLLMTVPCGNRC